MDCGTHENDLRELAAETISSAREAAVRAHLEACAVCREKLASEKMLFETLDAALKEEMNAAVPVGLAARIRTATRLKAGRPAAAWWRMPAFAALGVMTVALVVFIGLRATQSLPHPVLSVAKAPVGAALAGGSEARAALPRGPSQWRGVRSPRTETLEVVTHPQPRFEVLVPPGEEEALLRWIEQRDSQNFSENAEAITAAGKKSLEIAPLAVAQLEMKPLEEEGNRQQSGRGRN